MGVVFSQLIRKKLSTDNRYSGPPKLSRSFYRSGKPPSLLLSDNMISIGPHSPVANFAKGQMAGMALCRWRAQTTGFTCRQYLPKGRRFQSNCHSTPIPTSVCRRRTDFGAPSKDAVLVRLLLRSLMGVAGASS